MNEINHLIEIIKRSKNIIILTHVGPDGDTLGSMLALKEILSRISLVEKIDSVIVGKIPDIYKFLPNINSCKTHDDTNLYSSYDLAITVDCASIDRLGDALDLFRNAKITANIDHHISNTKFANINVIDPKASATGQIIYHFAKLLDVKITKEIAIDLYTSILTDTGGFKFENTRPETFNICANLVKAEADPVYIYQQCYESKPLAMVKLHAKAVEEAVFIENNTIAYTLVSRKMLEAFNASDDHVDGISEALRQINTVKVALVFKETQKGATKISMRSKKLDICEIARYFGGGGHRLAAGCTIEKPPVDAVNEVLPVLRKQISNHLANQLN